MPDGSRADGGIVMDEPRKTEERKPDPFASKFQMRMGADLRYHFEDPELRKRGGDLETVEWMEFETPDGTVWI